MQLALTADAPAGTSSGGGGLLLFAVLVAACAAAAHYCRRWKEQKQLEDQIRREEQFYEERAVIRKAGKRFHSSALVHALCKRIQKFPDSPEIKRIEIGTDCMTVTLDGLLKTEPTKTVPYASLTYKDLNEENCPLVACALAAELGVPFHVAFADGAPTAELIVVKDKLLDPNTETD